MSERDQPLGGSADRSGPPLIIIASIIAFVAGLAAMAGAYQLWGPGFGAPGAARPALTGAPSPEASPTTTPQSQVATLESREDELGKHITELESRLASVDTDSRVASSFASRAEGLLIAFAARRALDRGQALGYIEAQLRARFGSTEPNAVATIVQASREPETLEELRLALETLSPKLLTRNSKESWVTGLRRAIGNLVIVRREGTTSTLPADQLARARRMIDVGQVEGALAEVARLPGADDAESWMAAAKRYIDTRRALDSIETAAIQGRSATPVDPAPPPPATEPAPKASASPKPNPPQPVPASPPAAGQTDPQTPTT